MAMLMILIGGNLPTPTHLALISRFLRNKSWTQPKPSQFGGGV